MQGMNRTESFERIADSMPYNDFILLVNSILRVDDRFCGSEDSSAEPLFKHWVAKERARNGDQIEAWKHAIDDLRSRHSTESEHMDRDAYFTQAIDWLDRGCVSQCILRGVYNNRVDILKRSAAYFEESNEDSLCMTNPSFFKNIEGVWEKRDDHHPCWNGNPKAIATMLSGWCRMSNQIKETWLQKISPDQSGEDSLVHELHRHAASLYRSSGECLWALNFFPELCQQHSLYIQPVIENRLVLMLVMVSTSVRLNESDKAIGYFSDLLGELCGPIDSQQCQDSSVELYQVSSSLLDKLSSVWGAIRQDGDARNAEIEAMMTALRSYQALAGRKRKANGEVGESQGGALESAPAPRL